MTTKKKPTALLSYKEASELTGISVPGLRNRNSRGAMPTPDYTVGQSPAWLEDTLREWMDSAQFGPARPRAPREQ